MSHGDTLAGGANAPGATVCAEVIFVFGNVSCASCSQLWPAARALGTNALLTASNAAIVNLFTGSSSPSCAIAGQKTFRSSRAAGRRRLRWTVAQQILAVGRSASAAGSAHPRVPVLPGQF